MSELEPDLLEIHFGAPSALTRSSMRVCVRSRPSLRDLNHFFHFSQRFKRWAKFGRPSGADHASRPCSRNFRYKFRSLIPSILAAFPR
jgi:hypothetical protein